MTELTASPAALTDLSSGETMGLYELGAGDPTAGAIVDGLVKSISKVNTVTRDALAAAEGLRANDTMNPVGKARLLTELPQNAAAIANAELRSAEDAIAILQARLTSVVLQHDPKDDAAKRAELDNYAAGIKAGGPDAALALTRLAVNPRYSTYMAGSYGQSLAARFAVDHGALTRSAIQTMAQSGTPAQVRAAAALANLSKTARVHSLAKAGNQAVVRHITDGNRERIRTSTGSSLAAGS